MSQLTTFLADVLGVAEDKKATQVTHYDVTENCSFTENIVIMSVKNNIQLKALANSLERLLKEVKADDTVPDDVMAPARRSGEADSGWTILDMDGIVCHIMLQDLREFYDLDTLVSAQAVSVEHVN